MFSIFAVVILLMIYTGQEKLLYVPGQPIQFIEDNPPRYKNPEERGIKYEEIWLKSKDGTKLQGWFMYHEQNTRNKDTVIFLHENAGNIGLRLDYFELIYHKLEVNIVAVAYRGYSRSEGQPEQDGIIEDAQAMIDFCKKENRIDNNRVFIVGRSLGGAVGIHVQALLDQQGDDFIKGIIIENTFTSICDMADALFSFLKLIQPIKKMMLRLRWESIN